MRLCDPEARRDQAIARLRAVFGKEFVVLPRFTAANADDLAKALTDSTKVQGGDPLASATWFQRMARVRDGASRLNSILDYSEALNSGENCSSISLSYLTSRMIDRVGLPLQPGKSLPGGKLSIAI